MDKICNFGGTLIYLSGFKVFDDFPTLTALRGLYALIILTLIN